MRYVLFGDESTLPGMRERLGSAVIGSVVASNRQAARSVADDQTRVHPPAKSAEYPDFRAWLEQLSPDLILCFSYSMILGADLLAIPRLGAVNIHGGLLPRYRGANVLNWAIIEGADRTGVTAHFMTPGIDDGDIVLQREVPIRDDDTAVTLKHRLDEVGMSLVDELDAIARTGTLPRQPQDESAAHYYRRRTAEDGRIDWSLPTRDIYNLVRALVAPWPGAYYVDVKGHKVVLDRFLSMDEIDALRRANAG